MTAMIEMIDTVGWRLFSILSITTAVLYLGLTILGYGTEGPRYPIKFEFARPLRSIKRILVGMGVRAMALFLRAGDALFNPLFEASAQVGEWVTGHAGTETQARYRSRFI